MNEKPAWRVAIEQFERSIGTPIEEYVKTDEFADMAAKAAKDQSQVQHQLLSSTNEWLHSMNLPTATDIAELRAEIAELRSEVRALGQAAEPEPVAMAAKPEPVAVAAKPEPVAVAAKPEPVVAVGSKPKPKPKPKQKPVAAAARSKPKPKPASRPTPRAKPE